MNRTLKVTIDMNFEKEFNEYLIREKVEFKKVRYTKTMFRFKVMWPNTKPLSLLEKLPFVERVEDYPIVVLD